MECDRMRFSKVVDIFQKEKKREKKRIKRDYSLIFFPLNGFVR